MKNIDEIVEQAYKNAIENGYDLDSWQVIDVAEDMLTWEAELEDCEYHEVHEAIVRYRNGRSKNI